jgi:hypothetical protein
MVKALRTKPALCLSVSSEVGRAPTPRVRAADPEGEAHQAALRMISPRFTILFLPSPENSSGMRILRRL